MRDPAIAGGGGPAAAALLLLLLLPVLALVARRRWRRAVARQEEVRRLVRLAAEEAERAELEVALAYAATSAAEKAAAGGEGVTAVKPAKAVPAAKLQCAVCFSPTTRRCSRCKAVRYCSGKCQIIHWRQGHEGECHPPHVDDKYDAQPNISDSRGMQAEQSGPSSGTLESEGSPLEALETVPKKPASSESNCSPNVSDEDGNFRGRHFMDASGSESSSDSFVLSTPSSTTFFGASEISHDASASEESLQPHDDRPGKSLSCDSSSGSSRKMVDASDVNSASVSSSNLRQKASTSMNAEVASLSGSPSGVVNTSTFDLPSVEFSQRTGEDQESVVAKSAGDYPGELGPSSASSTSIKSSSGAASSEDRAHLPRRNVKVLGADMSGSVDGGSNNDTLLLKSKSLRSSASAPSADQLSSDAGTSLKADNAPNVPIRSPESTGGVPNGSAISVKRIVKKITSPKISRHYPSELMLFPYDLFIKLYNFEKVELRPCGLTNCGNSCYANAVLQCLAFTRPLTTYLLQGLHSKKCPEKEWCFTCEFESLLLKAKQGKSPLSPIGILSHLQNIGSNLGHGSEEDAHEFLRYAIDAMQSACLKEAGTGAAGRLAEETTLVQLTFGGYLMSKIKCMRCQGRSERHERMMDLTVEIHGDINTLEEALARFTSTEILDGENRYQCDRCKSFERAKKKLTILEAPNILTIALKRFQSGKFGKLNKTVRFPEYLNLARYMSGTDDKSPVYGLYAVVVHLDIMNAAFSGHYICYVKDTQGKWYKVDDSTVKPVDLENVLSKGVYMLLYARCSPRAPSSIRKAMSHELVHMKKIRSKESKAKPNPLLQRGGSSVGSQRSLFYPHWTMDDSVHIPLSDLFDYRLPPKTDSSSDSSSLFSCSDEGSWSTESTRDSSSTDEYSGYIFGESDRASWNSPLRFSEDLDGYTSSPLGSRHSSEAAFSGRLSDTPRSGVSQSNYSSPGREVDRAVEVGRAAEMRPQDGREAYLEGDEGPSFLYSDPSKQRSNLTSQSRTTETNWVNDYEAKSSVLLRRSTRERTAQTFY